MTRDRREREREQRYVEHRRAPSRDHARRPFASTVSFDPGGQASINDTPVRSQAVRMMSPEVERIATTQIGPSVEPTTFGAKMPEPRTKQLRNGTALAEQIDQQSESNASWPDFQATIEHRIISLEGRVRVNDRKLKAKLDGMENGLPKIADMQALHPLTARVAQLEVHKESGCSVGRVRHSEEEPEEERQKLEHKVPRGLQEQNVA